MEPRLAATWASYWSVLLALWSEWNMTLWALGWKHFFAWIRDLGKKTTQGSTATWTAVKHTGGHLVNHPSDNECKSCAQMAAQLRKDDEGRYERNGE